MTESHVAVAETVRKNPGWPVRQSRMLNRLMMLSPALIVFVLYKRQVSS